MYTSIKVGPRSEKVKQVKYRLLEHLYVYEINLRYLFGVSMAAANPSSCYHSSLDHSAQTAVAKLKHTSPLPQLHGVIFALLRKKDIFTGHADSSDTSSVIIIKRYPQPRDEDSYSPSLRKHLNMYNRPSA